MPADAEDQGTDILCVHVDGMIVVGDKLAVEAFKKEIKKFFNTKEEGMLDEYFGCKVTQKGNATCFSLASCTNLKRNSEMMLKRYASTKHQQHRVFAVH